MKKILGFFFMATFIVVCSTTSQAANNMRLAKKKITPTQVCCEVGFSYCGGTICIPNMCASSWSQLSNDIMWWQNYLNNWNCELNS